MTSVSLTGKKHDVKIWPPYFEHVSTDVKPWEYRKDDRGYKVGDIINLHEWCPRRHYYTGRAVSRVITYILHDGFGIPDGFVIMSLAANVKGTKIKAERLSVEEGSALMVAMIAFVIFFLSYWLMPLTK